MTARVVAQGSEWSASTLHDGWGEGVTDEQVSKLGALVVSRFEELAQTEGYTVYWFPAQSVVSGDVDVSLYDDHGNCILDGIREQAINQVWNAVIGNCGPMMKAVNKILCR